MQALTFMSEEHIQQPAFSKVDWFTSFFSYTICEGDTGGGGQGFGGHRGSGAFIALDTKEFTGSYFSHSLMHGRLNIVHLGSIGSAQRWDLPVFCPKNLLNYCSESTSCAVGYCSAAPTAWHVRTAKVRPP